MIDDYGFGSITIDGEIYGKDIEIRWDGEVLSWWRDDGHIFDVPDLERALDKNPDLIVLGTGSSGRADITKSLRDKLKKEGIGLIDGKTQDVIDDFNKALDKDSERVIGLFHLTC